MTRTITVKGSGSVSAKPDYITLMLSITETDKNYERAMAGAAKRIAALEAAAENTGFEKNALKTVSFHVSTQYESVKNRQGGYQSVFSGYRCAYQLKLAFDFDSKRFASVLSAVADSGADPELNISFTVKDPAKVSKELLARAAANAREKAEILCRASGAALGELISIDYNWNELNILSRTSCDFGDGVMPLMAARSCTAPEITPDDIDLHDTAAFVWEIH